MSISDWHHNYDTKSIENCEHINLMMKTYSARPKVINDKCYGFRNKYTGIASKICINCSNFIDRSEKNDIE